MKSKFVLLIMIGFLACKEPSKNDSRVERLPFYNEATFTPHWIASNSDVLDTFHKISSFSLTDQDGINISERTFTDKIYVVDFFFTTCPGICPQMMTNMQDLQDAFIEDDEIKLLSHSVMPERDSVSVLKAYAKDRGIISNKWHLVTGPQQEIYTLGRKDYFIEEDLGIDKAIEDFLHTENFVLIDKNKHIRGIYNGLKKHSINQLIADIKTLKREG